VRRTKDDRGVVLILVALAMVALLTIVAIVVDMGATRSRRQNARSAADAGSTAGSTALRTGGGCADAFSYAFRTIDAPQPTTGDITTACAALAGTCNPTAARTASLTSGSATVKVTNPVPDTSALMSGTVLGGSVAQSINPGTDGVPCDRIAVEITQPQAQFFGGIASSGGSTFTVKSVARYTATAGPATARPALVALDQSMCRAIDAGTNGNIILVANTDSPGIALSDSNGPTCGGNNAILASRSSARMVAESLGSQPGELGWFEAPSTRGYNNGSSTRQTAPATFASTTENYVGALTMRTERTTRQPVDRVYHCRNLPVTPAEPLCALAADPIVPLADLADGSGAPTGYTTYSGPCDTTGTVVTFTSRAYVDCDVFAVKTGDLVVPGGASVVFRGRLSVEAGGHLRVNATGATDASGYPVPTTAAALSQLIVRSTAADAIIFTTNSARVSMAQTVVYSKGGFVADQIRDPGVRWTPHTTGLLKGLMYWSESTQQFSLQGGPRIVARGVVFHGNGQLRAGGSGVVDLTNVQVWVDSVSLTGSPTLKLKADPQNSVAIPSSGSQLIR
jgi:Flp pilus assembly protein TadG